MSIFLEIKWQILRPIMRVSYGFAYLIMDFYLESRERHTERAEFQEAWSKVKDGIWTDNPYKTAEGMSSMKSKIIEIQTEAMT